MGSTKILSLPFINSRTKHPISWIQKYTPMGHTIFRKSTHTGQYINMDSFTQWKWKTAWIRSLAGRAKKICSKENLSKELQSIKKFASWNGYLQNIVNAIIKCMLSKETLINDVINEGEKDKIPTVFINVDYP